MLLFLLLMLIQLLLGLAAAAGAAGAAEGHMKLMGGLMLMVGRTQSSGLKEEGTKALALTEETLFTGSSLDKRHEQNDIKVLMKTL